MLRFIPKQTPFKISDGGGNIDISLSEGDQFGGASALSGDGTTLVISAPQSDSSKGSVYLFEKSNNTWTQSLKISDNDGGTGELDVPMSGTSYFGAGVSLSADGTLLAVGAYGQDSFKGAVYLFKKTNGTWAQSLKISDNDGGAGELDISLTAGHALGTSVALSQDGTLLAIGSRDASHKGAVYLFEKSGSTYVQKLKISDNESGTGELDVQLGVFSYFGSSIDFSADTTLMAVGADSVNGRGAVYLFEKRDGAWTQTLKIYDISGDADEGELDIELSSSDGFGIDVSLSDDGTLLVVGAYGTDKGETPDEVGAVYLFEKSSGTWSQSLEMSDNNGGTGKFDISLSEDDFFGTAVTISDNRDLLVIGAGGDSSYKGAVYIFEDVGVARSVFVTATDNEQNGSSWEYVTTTGSTCGAAQFATTQTAYTEGSRIAFTAESDAGKRVCFKTTDTAGNAAVYTLSEPVKTIDRTAPTLSVIRSGAGATANYRVNATDTATPITGRTKDNVATGSCTAGTDTSGTGWSDYTPGELTGTAHDTNGRCVIITDAAGNNAKQHLSDGDNTITSDFSLDLDASGTFEPNRDAILLYLYTNQGSSASELAVYVAGGQQGTAAAAVGRINAVKDNANTPMDMDGDNTFTANTDGAIPYLHSGQGYDATALVPFTHDRQQTTAANAITLVRGNLTPNWP